MELQQQRWQGLCFRCNEKFTSDHFCKRLYKLELQETDQNQLEEQAESDLEEGNPEQPKISLHALAGVQTPQTM